MTPPLTIIGNEGSPYSRKMRALLRYRNIPHRWVVNQGPEYRAPPKPAVDVIPVLVWHDEDGAMRESMIDSTPQIRRLEQEYTGRSVLLPDPALEFLSALVEDYADEWGTKLMFYYRWTEPAGIEWARQHLMRQINPAMPPAQLTQFAAMFGKRQVDRRGVVGVGVETAPVMEASYRRLLALLEALLQQRLFLFGARPAAADFGLYGQLTQLCLYDPACTRIAHDSAPRVVAWVQRIEDLSGWIVEDAQWLSRAQAAPTLQPLLREIGRTYLPLLLANAAAKSAGASTFTYEVDGVRLEQAVFPYQLKCLRWLREHFASLNPADQAWVREQLAAANCLPLLEA